MPLEWRGLLWIVRLVREGIVRRAFSPLVGGGDKVEKRSDGRAVVKLTVESAGFVIYK
jgi:hypothetical protein